MSTECPARPVWLTPLTGTFKKTTRAAPHAILNTRCTEFCVSKPQGLIWILAAGAASSIPYINAISQAGFLHELANVGEFDGDSYKGDSYGYADRLLNYLCSASPWPNGRSLIVADLSALASVFAGFIQALTQHQDALILHKVRIYVRRGGPTYQHGFDLISSLYNSVRDPLRASIRAFEPEMPLNDLILLILGLREEGQARIVADTKLGTYHVGPLLGHGSFGAAFLVRDQKGKARAMKFIKKSLLVGKPDYVKAALSEIRTHVLATHRHVCSLKVSFESTTFLYLVMELCEHGSLQQLLDQRQHITEPEWRYWAIQLAGALHYLHLHRVIHRDLKPANLLLDSNLDLKVADFGLAAILNKGEQRQDCVGTAGYTAPEIEALTNVGHSFEADMWSAGAVMHVMLLGQKPVVAQGTHVEPRDSNFYLFPTTPAVSGSAKDLILQLLSHRPSARPTAANWMHHAFFEDGHLPSQITEHSLFGAPTYPPAHKPADMAMLVKLRLHSFHGNIDAIRVHRTTVPSRPLVTKHTRAPLAIVRKMLNDVAHSLKENSRPDILEEMEVPGQPVFVTEYVYGDDQSHSYVLSNGDVCLKLNDGTSVILDASLKSLHFILSDSSSCSRRVSDFLSPPVLGSSESLVLTALSADRATWDVKMNLLRYAHQVFFSSHKEQGHMSLDKSPAPDFVRKFLSSELVKIFQLDSGTIQFDFRDLSHVIFPHSGSHAYFLDASKRTLWARLSPSFCVSTEVGTDHQAADSAQFIRRLRCCQTVLNDSARQRKDRPLDNRI